MLEKINSYRDLIVWEKAINLTVEIYKITENFPKEEIYGLTSQMRRSAVSIPSNIAEGRNRGTRKDFCNFLRIALGSCAELSTQIEIKKYRSRTYKTKSKILCWKTCNYFRNISRPAS